MCNMCVYEEAIQEDALVIPVLPSSSLLLPLLPPLPLELLLSLLIQEHLQRLLQQLSPLLQSFFAGFYFSVLFIFSPGYPPLAPSSI